LFAGFIVLIPLQGRAYYVMKLLTQNVMKVYNDMKEGEVPHCCGNKKEPPDAAEFLIHAQCPLNQLFPNKQAFAHLFAANFEACRKILRRQTFR